MVSRAFISSEKGLPLARRISQREKEYKHPYLLRIIRRKAWLGHYSLSSRLITEVPV